MKNNKFIKGIGLLIGLFVLAILPMPNASAWGPERPTFTMEKPADYAIFNSITNNPTIGDERDFVRVGEINADVTELKNEIEVIPGKQYLVYIYFHNNASATYNDSAHNNIGVAVATRMSSSFSTVITPDKKGTITGTITAENTNPTSVWDEAYMTTATDKVLLSYVSGSAKIYNDWQANGSIMPSSLFTEEGTLLGLNALNGVIPGCEEYHGVVSYVLEAKELSGTVEKNVSLDGANYSAEAEVVPGTEVYYKLTIKNTGDTALTNATIKDSLPEGLTLIPGSVELWANESSTKDPLSDNIINTGYNLGAIGTGNTIYITYRAKVGEDLECGHPELLNNAKLTYDSEISSGDADEDSASIKIKCEELPSEIVNTGPAEVIMSILIVLIISGGGYYLYRSRRTLKKVTAKVEGHEGSSASSKEPTDNSENKTDPNEKQ